MAATTSSAEFLARAGLPGDPGELIGRRFRFVHEEDGGYELGGVVEAYEIHGAFSIRLYINRPHRYLSFAAVQPPYGDGVHRWRLVDTLQDRDRERLGAVELL